MTDYAIYVYRLGLRRFRIAVYEIMANDVERQRTVVEYRTFLHRSALRKGMKIADALTLTNRDHAIFAFVIPKGAE